MTRIPRSENNKADALARLASKNDMDGLISFLIERLDQLSIKREEQVCYSENAAAWMDPIVEYLTTARLPENREEVRRVKNTSARYNLINGKLYHRGHSVPY
ncbi:hypothetical protein TIFTF001_032921 [Ficus carica]|uniref:Reverse transcriptase domain-containing protein n=1 Tax=Ficus carica TaxID=3494 RepID=A0AA88E119_FICCA|nr:hypothetical protein TIFTF001_032921 [Ficus carica]